MNKNRQKVGVCPWRR